MTSIIQELKPGDQLSFRGPIGSYDMTKNTKTNIGMIAGGAGITPMLQIIRGVVKDKTSNTKITLLFGNQTEQDIILKDELDKIAQEHPDRFKVVYALDKAPKDWDGVSGYITKEVVQAHMPGPDDKDAVIMVCGPPPMLKSIAGDKPFLGQGKFSGVLKELGYSKNDVYKF
jgi:cytochrome-b5 reductase